MRILFVHNRYQFHGGEDAVLDVEAALLKRKGHEVDILLFSNDAIQGLGGKIKAGLRSFHNNSSAAVFKEAVDRFRPDVIHVHNLWFEASPSIITEAFARHLPLVMTIHNYRLLCVNALLLRNNKPCELCVNHTFAWYGIRYRCYHHSYIESALVAGIAGIHKMKGTWQEKVTQFIAPAAFIQEKMRQSSLQLPEGKIAVKPNFIEDPGVSTLPRQDYFLFVGRLTESKGIHTLLSVFEANPQYQLVIAGDGPDREEVLQRIAGKGNISYAGLLGKAEVLMHMRQCTALLFPSIWYEGLPVTIIESFACGTPVIASQLGAMADMITDGENGFHFTAGDTQSLTSALSRWTDSSAEVQEKLRWGARKSYESAYHPDVHYAAVMRIYEQVIEQKKNELRTQ